LPGYEVQGWLGLTAPAGTPKEVIERMNVLMGQAIADPALREALERQGMTPRGMSPSELTAYIAADRTRWAEWIRTANIQPE
jgi:tripartite-type tricarboxylate transporter receptor subunit TctC